MFYAIIILMRVIAGGAIEANVVMEETGYEVIDDCANQLNSMRIHIIVNHSDYTIVRQECRTKKDWIEFFNHDPWERIVQEKKGQEV